MPHLDSGRSIPLLLMGVAQVYALKTPPTAKFSEIGTTSEATKSLVSGLTAVVNALGAPSPPAAARTRAFKSLDKQAVLDGLEKDFVENEYLWSGKITAELYDEECVFTDPTLSFAGLSTFESNLRNLDPYIERFVPPQGRRVELRSLNLVDGGAVVEAEWRMVGALAVPWRARLDLEGRTRYTLGGEGGRISAYDESWAITPFEALRQLVTPTSGVPDAADKASGAKASGSSTSGGLAGSAGSADARVAEAEHWTGRLSGAPPPKPAVVLVDAPPFVLLPGFGNARGDYVAPLGQPEEVGLAAALRRRGVADVCVVPIGRSAWLNVLRGVLDPAFWAGNAQPDGAAFAWYLRAARAQVERAVAERRQRSAEADGRVVLVGHSAGGWLARALCLDEAWARSHVRGLVTLGAPHTGPPPGVADQVRGTLRNLNARAPGSALADGHADLFYLTVGSAAVRGDSGAPRGSAARTAFDSYFMVCGEGAVAGDGIVPLCAAHLDGAAQLTLDCVHSINEPGSAQPIDRWYGAEPYIDSWLRPVAARLRAQAVRKALPLPRMNLRI